MYGLCRLRLVQISSSRRPIEQDGRPVGVVSITSAAGELDALVSREREQVLRLFVSMAVSVILSLVLASTIANPPG